MKQFEDIELQTDAEISGYTASRALISNADGKIAVHATVSDTEIGYLSGVTGSIGDHMGSTSDPHSTIPSQTGNDAKFLTTDGANCSWAAVSGTGTLNQIKEGGSTVGDADIVTIDFDGDDFNVSESPDTEVNITINDGGIDHNSLANYAAGEHRTIDDGGTASTDLWSAEKITSELSGKQASDADLTTIAGLDKTDGNFIVGTGAAWAAESGETVRTSLGLAIGSDVQAYDAGLADIAGLGNTDSHIIIGDGSNWVCESGTTARTSLGVSIGSDVQAYDAGLDDISGLSASDGAFVVGDGSNWTAESGTTVRTSLGLAIGTDVQAHDDQLDDIAALAVDDGNIIVADGANWTVESGATARASLGVAIDSDVQAYNAGLADIAGLGNTDSYFIVGDGSNWVAETGATARASLGLSNETTHHLRGTCIDPNGVYGKDHEVCVWCKTDGAITVTGIDLTCDADPSTEMDIDLMWADAFIGLGNSAAIDECNTVSGATSISTGFDDATVASGKCIYWLLNAEPDSDITQFAWDVKYTYD